MAENGVDHLFNYENGDVGVGYDNEGFQHPENTKMVVCSSKDTVTIDVLPAGNGQPPTNCSSAPAEGVVVSHVLGVPNGHGDFPSLDSDERSSSSLNGSAVVNVNGGSPVSDDRDDDVNINTDTTKELKCPLDSKLRHYVADNDAKMLNSEDLRIPMPGHDDSRVVVSGNHGQLQGNGEDDGEEDLKEKIPLKDMTSAIPSDAAGEKAMEAAANDHSQNGRTDEYCCSRDSANTVQVPNDKMQQGNGAGYDEYFIPVNTHKKYLRGEKLYLTKDSKKICQSWRRVIICGLIVIVIAVAVLVGVLSATGILIAESESKNTRHDSHVLPGQSSIAVAGHHSSRRKPIVYPPKTSTTASNDITSPVKVPAASGSNREVSNRVPSNPSESQSVVPNAVVGEIVITDENFTEDLKDNTSFGYMQLKTHLEDELVRIFKRAGLQYKELRVLGFSPGSIRVKFALLWNVEKYAINAEDVRMYVKHYLKSRSNTFLGFQVDPNQLVFEDVTDECYIQKGGCSHDCLFDYNTRVKICLCDEGMQLDSDGKTCRNASGMTTTEYPTTTTTLLMSLTENLQESTTPSPGISLETTVSRADLLSSSTTEPVTTAATPESVTSPTVTTEVAAKSSQESTTTFVSTTVDDVVTPHIHRHDLHTFPGEIAVNRDDSTTTQRTVVSTVQDMSTQQGGAENLQPLATTTDETNLLRNSDNFTTTTSETEQTTLTSVEMPPSTELQSTSTSESLVTDVPVTHTTDGPITEHAIPLTSITNFETEKDITSEFVVTSTTPDTDTTSGEATGISSVPSVTTVNSEIIASELNANLNVTDAPILAVKPLGTEISYNTTESPETTSAMTDGITEPADITPTALQTEMTSTPLTDMVSTFFNIFTGLQSTTPARSEEAGTEPVTEVTAEDLGNTANGAVIPGTTTVGRVVGDSTVDSTTVSLGDTTSFSSNIPGSPESSTEVTSTLQTVTGAVENAATKATTEESVSTTTTGADTFRTEAAVTPLTDGVISTIKSVDGTTFQSVTEGERSSTVFTPATENPVPTTTITKNSEISVAESTTNSPGSDLGFMTTVQSIPETPMGTTMETESVTTEDGDGTVIPVTTVTDGFVDMTMDANDMHPDTTVSNVDDTTTTVVTEPVTAKEVDSSTASSGTLVESKSTETVSDRSDVHTTDSNDNLTESTKFLEYPNSTTESPTGYENLTKLYSESPIMEMTTYKPSTFALDSTTVALDSTTVALDSTAVALDSTTVTLDSTTDALDSTTIALDSTTVALDSTTTELTTTTTDFTTTEMSTTMNVTDIAGIECREDQFLCKHEENDVCFNNTFLCDGITDCDDKFDESNCTDSCMLNFRCVNSSTCVTHEVHCDGIWDCDDGSDEENCTPTECAKHEVMCLDGSACIKPGDICDWKYNCRDRSDEVGCMERTTCESGGRFFCNDGLCIPWSLKCDGEYDCKEKEDEGNCTCLEDEFKCNDGHCLKSSTRCDGHQDCINGEDEMGCVSVDDQGIVMTYETYSGSWSLVCGDDWNLDHGHYLCQELGYGHALSTETHYVSFNGTWMAMKRENLTGSSLWTERVTYAESCSSNLAAGVICQQFDCGNYSGLLHRRRRRNAEESSSRRKRQDDGASSPNSQWPFMAYVTTYKTSKGCLAEILTPVWLVTSAECLISTGKELQNGSDWYVRTNLEKGINSDLARNHEVLKIVSHPHSSKYRSLTLRDYDVALVRLKHALVFSEKIGAICLPEEQVSAGITCFSGILGPQTPRAPPPESPVLSSLAVMVLERDYCNQADQYNGQVNSRMLCTKNSDDQQLCDNDVGTPLMCLSGPNKWYLAGMLSYQRYCNILNWHPAVFSNLYAMRGFVDQVMGKKHYNIAYNSNMYIIVPPTTTGAPETTTASVGTTTTDVATTITSTTAMETTTSFIITTTESEVTLAETPYSTEEDSQEVARFLDGGTMATEATESYTVPENPEFTTSAMRLESYLNGSLDIDPSAQGNSTEASGDSSTTDVTMLGRMHEFLNDSEVLSFRQPADAIEDLNSQDLPPEPLSNFTQLYNSTDSVSQESSTDASTNITEAPKEYVMFSQPNTTGESSGYRSLVEDFSNSPHDLMSKAIAVTMAEGSSTSVPGSSTAAEASEITTSPTTADMDILLESTTTGRMSKEFELSSVAVTHTDSTPEEVTMQNLATSLSSSPIDGKIVPVNHPVADALKADAVTDPTTATTLHVNEELNPSTMYHEYLLRSRNIDVPVMTTASADGDLQTTHTVPSSTVYSSATGLSEALKTGLVIADTLGLGSTLLSEPESSSVRNFGHGSIQTEPSTTSFVTYPSVDSTTISDLQDGSTSPVMHDSSTELLRLLAGFNAPRTESIATSTEASSTLPQSSVTSSNSPVEASTAQYASDQMGSQSSVENVGETCGHWDFDLDGADGTPVAISNWPSLQVLRVHNGQRSCLSSMISPRFAVVSSSCLPPNANDTRNLFVQLEDQVIVSVNRQASFQNFSNSNQSFILVKFNDTTPTFACLSGQPSVVNSTCAVLSVNIDINVADTKKSLSAVAVDVTTPCDPMSDYSIHIEENVCITPKKDMKYFCQGSDEAVLFCLDKDIKKWAIQGFLQNCGVNHNTSYHGLDIAKPWIIETLAS